MKPLDRDRIMREALVEYLNSKGYDAKEAPTKRYFDVVAYKDEREYRFELKYRNVDSKKFGDHIFELIKLQCFERDRKDFEDAYLVSYFTDGILRISNVFNDEHTIIKRRSPKETEFSNHNFVDKLFVSYTNFKDYKAPESFKTMK